MRMIKLIKRIRIIIKENKRNIFAVKKKQQQQQQQQGK